MKVCRGVRGATTVEENRAAEIIQATGELLERMVEANRIASEDIASAIFTTTPDLDATFPAQAARELGWQDVALLCTHEMTVPGSLDKCIRILLHWNTEKQAKEIVHVYLQEAESLRSSENLLTRE